MYKHDSEYDDYSMEWAVSYSLYKYWSSKLANSDGALWCARTTLFPGLSEIIASFPRDMFGLDQAPGDEMGG